MFSPAQHPAGRSHTEMSQKEREDGKIKDVIGESRLSFVDFAP